MFPSGEQHQIAFEDQRGTVVEVGGGIREYAVGDRDVLDPYPVGAICDGAHGAPLIPWPNRLADGRYSFDGAEYQVALSEPAKHNAIHGLLRWRNWQLRDRDPARVVLENRLYPSAGYPFTLELTISYELAAGGLIVTTTSVNIGEQACPFGSGQHPYLSPGNGLLDECSLQLAAQTRILTDDERQLPVGREPVAGTPFDFREPRRLGALAIDSAFADLSRDETGLAWARLTGPDSRTAELWVDEHYPLIEIYTGDGLSAARRRRGLGAEPMTCPPNALQSGEGIVRLEPGEALVARWGVRLS
ncbi:MAG TPA: aldose 1-epimerase family protein [Solirubrobacteraceae bacterium]